MGCFMGSVAVNNSGADDKMGAKAVQVWLVNTKDGKD
jgi:hypothetical protein